MIIFCNICFDFYILVNGDLYYHLPSEIDKTIRLFCLDILVLVHLPINYINGYTRVCSLNIMG
jgi:hypothetical protein